ncbi:unnamed protein product [Effrenium voratum]|nr:unnamed protein product [Effrenium voratum]
MAEPVQVAVIGAGFLGARIISELLLLGCKVSVFDQGVAKSRSPQEALNSCTGEIISECVRLGLLEMAEMKGPEKGAWVPFEGEGRREALACKSVAEAAKDAELVIEAVPDKLDIKSKVFAEALQQARPGVLLATNTLSISLKALQEAVHKESKSGLDEKPRVVGLRFLSPVTFVPFVEVTLTAEQEQGSEKEDLLRMLRKWGKACFICDIQGAVESEPSSVRLARERLRLDHTSAMRRQVTEAQLRGALRRGEAPVMRKDYCEPECCICYEATPTVPSIICGHKALCEPCALVVESGTRQCPLCRERFVRRGLEMSTEPTEIVSL